MWSLRSGAAPAKVTLDPAAQDNGRYVIVPAADSVGR